MTRRWNGPKAAGARRRLLGVTIDALQARIDAALALHREWRIYEECGHQHTDEDVAEGRAKYVLELGDVCEDGYAYSICRECCTDDGYQREDCAGGHPVGLCYPCPTRCALTG